MNFSVRLKKLFCLVLTLVLVIGLFAGCSEKDNESSDSIVSSDKQQANTSDDGSQNNDVGKDDKNSDDVEPLPEGIQNIATLPKFDIEEDKVVKVIAWWVHPKVGDPDINLWPQTDRLLKQIYDVDVEYIKMPAGEVPTKHAAMVMAGDPADVVGLQNWADYPYSFTNGLYEPLDDLMPFDHEIFDPVRKYIDDLRVNGKAYWSVDIARCSPPIFMYNKTLIEEAGLEDPWELVKRNEWTWDKFFEYCKELTVDKDGDGVADQYGAAVMRGFFTHLAYTIGYPISKIDNNNVEINLRDEALMELYEFIKKVGPFGEGVFHPLSLLQGDAHQKRQDEFLNGNIAFYHDWDMGVNPGNPLRPMFEKGEINALILPRYPKADQQYMGIVVSGSGISKGAKHPQAAAAYITLKTASYFKSAAEILEDDEKIVSEKEKELGVDLASMYKNKEYELSKFRIFDWLYVAEIPAETLGIASRSNYIEKKYLQEFPERIVFDFGQFAGLTNFIEFERLFYGDQNGNPVTAQQIIEQITPQIQEKIDKFEKALNGES